MKDERILKLANQSMKENLKVLTALGEERSVQLKKNPDQDLIDVVKDLMPKSTAGKIAVIGIAALIAYAILKSK